MKIFMVRHGQTDSNAQGRIQGRRIDESLNEEGRRQASELAENMKGMTFDVIFSSPLKRARETAEIISHSCSTPIVLRDELEERDYGSLSGKTWPEMDEFTHNDQGALRALDLDQKYDYRPYGGENAADMEERLMKFIREIKETHKNKKVLVVAHAGVLRISHHLFRKQKVGHIKNASIEEFEV